MHQKRLYILTLFFFYTPLTFSMETSNNQNLKIASWVAATFGTQLVPRILNAKHYSKKLEEATNLTFHDIAATGTLSTTLMVASYAFSEDRRDKIQNFALRFPLAALLSKLITCKLVKQSTRNIPVINWYLGCPNNECTGLCNSCALRNMVIFTGLIRVIV